jgi:hypothetical protein
MSFGQSHHLHRLIPDWHVINVRSQSIETFPTTVTVYTYCARLGCDYVRRKRPKRRPSRCPRPRMYDASSAGIGTRVNPIHSRHAIIGNPEGTRDATPNFTFRLRTLLHRDPGSVTVLGVYGTVRCHIIQYNRMVPHDGNRHNAPRLRNCHMGDWRENRARVMHVISHRIQWAR